MDELVLRGIIIRQTNYGEAHRMLTIFTAESGIVKAVRYGVRGKKSSNAAAFQMLCYGDFKLRPAGGGIMTAVSADVIDGFYPVSEDIVKLSLLAYLSDITYRLLGEGNPDKRILSLFLNTVYAASYRNEPLMKLKAVYELKLMSAGGYMPNLSSCCVCGKDGLFFNCDKGELFCREHHNAGDKRVENDILQLMRYITHCEDKKMLSFTVSDEGVYNTLNEITEKYVSVHCDKTFSSLDYFKAMLEM